MAKRPPWQLTSRPRGFTPDTSGYWQPDALWFFFEGARVLLEQGGGLPRSQELGLLLDLEQQYILGEWQGQTVFGAAVAAGTEPPEGGEWVSLRQSHTRLEPEHFSLATYAVQILDFHRTESPQA